MVKWNEMSLQETLEYMSKLDSGAPNSQNYFADVAMHDSHRPLQMLAVTKLTDQALLAKVASYHTDYEIYRIALQKISDPALISEVARNAWDIYACLLAVRKMDNPEELLQIARYHTKGEVRREAVKKINQPKHLMQIMQTNSDDTVRAAAVKKLTDPDLLFRIAREETVPEVYREALEILEEQTKIAVVFQENILQPKGKIALRRLKDLAQIYGIEEEILPVLAKGMEKSELVMMVMDVMESSGLAWWAYCWEVTVEALYEISKRRQSWEETKSVESAIQTIYRYREDLRPAIESYAWFAHHRLDDRDEYVILPMRFDYPEKKK